MIEKMKDRISFKNKSLQKWALSLYFALVAFIGLNYIYKSHGGNISTIIEYINGNRAFPIDALIYTSILELLFELFSVIGSSICIFYISRKSAPRIKVLFMIHLSTVILYIARSISLIQSVTHLSTQGAIKNTEMWDWGLILDYLWGSSNIRYTIIILLLGLPLIKFLRIKRSADV